MVTAESPASRVGHITLGRKRAGKPIAGNRHDGFEVAGAGTQLTVWLLRHSQRKRGATDRLNLRSMAPVLDPTSKSGKFKDEDFQEIVAEFVYVFFHLCDRDAYGAIPAPQKRSTFLDSVFYYILQFGKTSCMTVFFNDPATTER